MLKLFVDVRIVLIFQFWLKTKNISKDIYFFIL